MSKGFDIRSFRIKQAAQREAQKGKKAGAGLATFNEDDDFGVSMPTMGFSKKAAEMQIDSEKVI